MIRRPPRSTLFPTRRSSDLSGFVAFSHGANDAQKTMAIITLALFSSGYLPEFVVPRWVALAAALAIGLDRKSTRLNSSHANISYAVFCLKKKKNHIQPNPT